MALEWVESDPVRVLRHAWLIGWDDEDVDILLDYVNAKMVYDGMMQGVRDGIDEDIAASDAAIDSRVNNETGQIHPAIMKLNDRKVYVVGGNLILNDDGTVDKKNTDESLIIVDAETGKVEYTDPSAILSSERAIDAAEQKQMAAEQIRREYARRAANHIDGVLPFNTGDTYTINDKNGQLVDVTLVGPAVDEQGVPMNGRYIVQWPNGQTAIIEGETLQAMADAANLRRLNQFERERQAQREQRRVAQAEASRPQYNVNDKLSLEVDGQIVRGSVTAPENEDGLIEVFTEDPINGNKVNMFTREELDAMNHQQQAQQPQQAEAPTPIESVPETPESVPTSTENPVSEGESVPQTDVPVENGQQTALRRLPKDAEGEPVFEQAPTPEDGWDAAVEYYEGDTAAAKEMVDLMASEKKKALEKAQKAKAKGKTPKEIKASQKANAANLAQAQAEFDLWDKMSRVEQSRQAVIRSQQEAEARQRAIERAEAEKAEREAQEEAARVEREALEGIPEWHLDTPENARKRGVRRFSGEMYTRQEPVQGVAGKDVEVKFSQDDLPKGKIAVIEASQLQPSHIQGRRNPMFFIEEAQPKNRSEAVSSHAARQIAEGIRPEEITGGATAYTGAPTVNARGEVIQGNNRSDALRYLWDNNLPEQQATYKQYLIDNAEALGLDPGAVSVMQQPVLVNMLDVDDAEAIRLGQMTAQDTESGGIERIKPKNVAQKLGENMRHFANMLLRACPIIYVNAEVAYLGGILKVT